MKTLAAIAAAVSVLTLSGVALADGTVTAEGTKSGKWPAEKFIGCSYSLMSPRDLASDIDHWLADEPVSCFREPLSFRARRWLRKHPGITTGVAATVLVGILGLAGGLYFVSVEKNRTEQARIAAELSEEKAKTEGPDRKGPEGTARHALST